MATVTIRLPDGKHERLMVPADSNSVSVNKSMNELAPIALANCDAREESQT